jgi:AraC family transcriptional regulator
MSMEIRSKLTCCGLTFREALYAEPQRMPMHCDQVMQVNYLLAGTILHSSPSETQQIEPSTLTFLPENSPHANEFRSNVRSFEILALPSYTERLRQANAALSEQQIRADGIPNQIVRRIYSEFQSPDGLTPLMLEGLAIELFVALERTADRSKQGSPPRWLASVREYLHANFTATFSLETVAEAAGVHPSHLARTFRQHYFCTLGEYVRRLRIERACASLTRSEPCLAELATELGFADQGHFSRTFKQVTGKTPTAFRNGAGPATRR